MSDHFNILTVVLEDDFTQEGAQAIAKTIEQIRGVATVRLGKPTDGDDYANRAVLRVELRVKLHRAIEGVFEDPKP